MNQTPCHLDSIVARRRVTPDFLNTLSHKQTLALPKEVEHWSPTTLQEKLVKIGAKVARHGRYVRFQLARSCRAVKLVPENLSPD